MTMKHFKLLLLSLFLITGTSATWAATKDYYVNYETEFLSGTGFTINTNNSSYITNIQTFGNITSIGAPAVADLMVRVTYSGINSSDPGYVNYVLAQEVANCIIPINPDPDNYTAKTVVTRSSTGDWLSGYTYTGANTVYITYVYNEALSGTDSYGNLVLNNDVLEQHEWTPAGEHFTYSDLYVKTNSTRIKNVIKLGSNQCAVRLNNYTDAEITIPLRDSQKQWDVVAIQYMGMLEEVPHTMSIFNCQKFDDEHTVNDYRRSGGTYDSELGSWIVSSSQTNSHSNSNLVTVMFQKDATTGTSNVKSIGDYAFMSCKVLQTIEIPQSVWYLGDAAFSQCEGLVDGLTFQRNANAELSGHLKVIRNYTFWNCRNMTDLELPDGIVVIEGQQSGSSMQYMESLTHLRLPNTLLAVGPHFLCDASSLTTVDLPASLRYIDGACFHGCENLKEVYLLGPASAIQGAYDGSDTFGSNMTLCKDHVNQCVFITTQENIRGYVEDPNGVWQLIADNKDSNCSSKVKRVKVDEEGKVLRDDDGNFIYETGDNQYLTYADGTTVEVKQGSNGSAVCSEGWDNALSYIPDQTRTFTPGKWVSVIFPQGFDADALKAAFGQDVTLAEMTGRPTWSVKNGKRVYHLNFTEVTAAEAHRPYMIKPGKKSGDNDYDVVMIASNQMNESYREHLTMDHPLNLTATDGVSVIMYGRYKTYTMQQYQFFFQNPIVNGEYNKKCVFKRIMDKTKAPEIKPFRCYWKIWLNGEEEPDATASGGAKDNAFFYFAEDGETTGIEQVDSKVGVEIDGIYDLNGHKLDIAPEDLPRGIFIMNGKKVLVK